METPFGDGLREWRAQRRMSQLDLGLAAEVSARHISFLESGRAKPSRSMVLQLCETLSVPRSARNVLLNAAGFAPAYQARDWHEPGMAQIHEAVDWMLQRHAPYPALALDRHWTIVRANMPATFLIAAADLKEGDNLLHAMTNTEMMKDLLENWQEVAQHMIMRLRTESSHLGGDKVLDAAARKLVASLAEEDWHNDGVLPPVVPARYRAGTGTLAFFSTLAQFGTAEDIALAELKIEMMFPADEATKTALLNLSAGDA